MMPRFPATISIHQVSCVAVILACLLFPAGEAKAQTVYNWTAGDILTGSITPSGVTTITSVDSLNIGTGADHDFNGSLVTNNGIVNWVAGNLRSGSGGTITNNALWNDSSSGYQINNAFGGTGGTSFVNAATGTYSKTAGTTDFVVGLTNAGTISVTGGALNLDAGGTFTDGSVVGSSGAGVLQLLSGTLTMTGSITATNFLFNGGNFAGDQTFTASTVNWQTGSWNSANTTTLAGGTTLNITSGSDHDFQSHAIVNNGTVNWMAGNLRSGSGGSITNNGTWNDSIAGYQINNAFGGTGGTVFINGAAGTYSKTAGITDLLVPFGNYGLVVVSGGVLNLDAGGTFYDGSSIGSTGTGVARLNGGVLTGGGTSGFTATNFLLTAGQLSGNMTFLGTTSWIASNFNTAGTATIGATGTLDITTGNNHDFISHAIVNNGTVNWTAGNIRSGSGGTITNNSIWNDSSDTYQINNAFGGTGGTSFINAASGTYNKTAGTTTLNNNVLVNDGSISVTGGVLNLVGGILNDGSSIGSSGPGVVQLTGSVLTASGTINVQNFLLNGGQLTGTQTFAGTFSWLTGDLDTAGAMTIDSPGTLTIGTGSDHDFNSHAIINDGTVNWTAGNLRSGSGGTITNNGTWNDSIVGYQINNAYGGTGGTSFINAASGTYNKTAGTTTLNNNVLVNDGSISVTGGVLNLVGGILNDGSSIGSSGPGVVQLTGSVLTASGTINVQNFLLNGGRLAGDQTFAGTFSWLTGDLDTANTMTIGPAGNLTIATGSDHDFNSHAIINNGMVNWTAGNLRSGNGGTITNNAVWNDSSNGFQINNAFGGTDGTTFLNATTGVYNKTAGLTTLNDSVFANSGTVNVTGGQLNLTGATFTDGSTIGSSGPGVVQFIGGMLTASGTVNVQNFIFKGGRLAGDQTFAGTLSWQAGDLDTANTMTIGPAGNLTIATGSDHDFNSHAIINDGTVNWTAGNLRSGSGGTITNNGTWNDSIVGYQINNAFGGTGGTAFVNTATGVYNKTAGTTTVVVPLTNSGLINLTGGSLALASTFTNTTGTVALANGTTLTSTSPLVFGAGSLLRGDGTVTASAISIAGALEPGTTSTAGQLSLTGNLSLLATAQPAFELGGTTQGSQYDHLLVNGNLSLGGNLAVGLIGGFENTVNNAMTFDVVSSTALSGSFANVANGARLPTTDGLFTFVVNYGPGSGFALNDVVLSEFISIPEPSTWALLLTGTGLVAWSLRRRFH